MAMVSNNSAFNPTHKRISRTAECLQWTGDNTKDMVAFLNNHGLVGEIFRGYIQVYKNKTYHHTIRVTDWVIKQEDGQIKFCNGETMALKYQAIGQDSEIA